MPSFWDLKTHYCHELGFLACAIMLVSIIIFFIACITALPPIYRLLNTPAKLIGAYWAPQVVGGVGFIVAGLMLMIETQEHWSLLAPCFLGWHIGAWNAVGGVVSLSVDLRVCGTFADSNAVHVRASHYARFLG